MRKLIFPVVLALLVGGIVLWRLSHREQSATATPAPATAAAVPVPSAPAPTPTAAPAPAAQKIPVSDPALGRVELQASERMYAAHAPLRSPEVTDPDTAANRAILTTMVNKALARAKAEKAPAPAPAATTSTR